LLRQPLARRLLPRTSLTPPRNRGHQELRPTYSFIRPGTVGGAGKKWSRCCGRREHDVHTPTLTGLGERSHLASPDIGLETHIQDIVHVLKYEDLGRVILVGHSSSGAVITASPTAFRSSSRTSFTWMPSCRTMAKP
jgi:hypothetical protein